ncbi:hypothetical protein Gotur_010160, partial [Gossypium turneri]
MEKATVDLSLEDVEEDTLQLRVDSVEKDLTYENCFVGIFLTSSVLFRFYLEANMDRIEKDRAWNFISYLLILHRLVKGKNPLGVELNW